MKFEAINQLLDVLVQRLNTEGAVSEIRKIRNILTTCQDIDISAGAEVLCRSLALSFSLPFSEVLGVYVLKACREVFRWTSDRKKLLDAVDDRLERGPAERADAHLIYSILLWLEPEGPEDRESAVRWGEEARKIAARLGQDTLASWAERICVGINVVEQGNRLLAYGHLEAAIAAYQQAISRFPDFISAWLNLGTSYLMRNKPYDRYEALKAAKQVLRIDPEHWYARQILAEIYLNQGKLEEAEGELQKAMSLEGAKPSLLHALGIVRSAQGKANSAISLFRRAIALKSNLPIIGEPWLSLGCELQKRGQYEDAISAYQQAVTITPTLWPPWGNLIHCLLKMNRLAEAAQEVRGYLAVQLFKRIPMAAIGVARDFSEVVQGEILTNYELLAHGCPDDGLPGCGRNIVDLYLNTVQESLIGGLKFREFNEMEVATGLLRIGMLWCWYARKLSEKELSKEFARERLYAIKQRFNDVLPLEEKMSGFASIWPELEARMETTSPKEFGGEMLRHESKWLKSVGIRRAQGEVEDLRMRLQGNLWVHLCEYEKEQERIHLERVHYYMELLKGHTVLHKLTDPEIMSTMIDAQRWNHYIGSLPVKVDSTAVVDLKTCLESLPENAIAISFFRLRRILLPDLLLTIVLRRGQKECLKVVRDTERLMRFEDAAKRLKQLHHQVAVHRKVPATGRVFCELSGEEKELKGKELVQAIVEWEKKQLRQAYESILEGVIDVEELRGTDLYVSPSPEMYSIPFGLLLKGDEFLNSIVRSITIVPIFSLEQFRHNGYFPDKEGLVLCLDQIWEDEAKKRAASRCGKWCKGVPYLMFEHDLPNFKGDVMSKYNEWIRAMVVKGRPHIIGHHDVSEWSRSTKQEPNLGDFGRYLYEAPQKLSVDILSLEACWGGTWSEPEDLMGLFVSFLASGVSHVIASPYSVVPTATSGKLFDCIYGHSIGTKNGNINLQIACALREAAESVRQASLNSDDTIPTLWGALQLYGIV